MKPLMMARLLGASSSKMIPSGRGSVVCTIALGCRSVLHATASMSGNPVYQSRPRQRRLDYCAGLLQSVTSAALHIDACRCWCLSTAPAKACTSRTLCTSESTHLLKTKVRSWRHATLPMRIRTRSPSKSSSTGQGVYDTGRNASSPCPHEAHIESDARVEGLTWRQQYERITDVQAIENNSHLVITLGRAAVCGPKDSSRLRILKNRLHTSAEVLMSVRQARMVTRLQV